MRPIYPLVAVSNDVSVIDLFEPHPPAIDQSNHQAIFVLVMIETLMAPRPTSPTRRRRNAEHPTRALLLVRCVNI